MIAATRRNKTGSSFLKKYTGATRAGIHMAFWIMFFLFLRLYFGNINVMNGPLQMQNYWQMILFCSIMLFVSIYLHYGTIYLIMPSFKRNVALGTTLVLVYIFSAYWLNQLLLYHFMYGPGDQDNHSLYSRHLLSFRNTAFFLNISIYLGCLTITLKLGFNYYLTARKTLLLTQLRNDMEVEFLKSQIKPHFLFNALNSIYGIALNDKAAITILLDFSRLLRYLLYHNQEQVTLEEELDIIRIFSTISQQLNPALQVDFNFDNIEDRVIKKYSLFSQVQNILNTNAAAKKEYTLTLDNGKLYFR